jgi:uncharacterized protein (TIGR02147 family)
LKSNVIIFDHNNYKAYLREWIQAKPRRGRGEKSRMAAFLRCHTAYITHIFRGEAHLSLEQSADLSNYLGHTPEEKHFFLLLVQLARAGNPSLQSYLAIEIQKVLEARTHLKNRLEYKKQLSDQDQSTYYSTWYYSAIYALSSVPQFQNASAMAKQLNLPLKVVSEVLEFLLSRGILILDRGKIIPGTTSIHLGSDSPMIVRHHMNWRLQAMKALDQPTPQDLHYSSVVSLSEADSPKVRAILIKAIEEIREVIKTSPEEKVMAYAFDLFDLGQRV